MKLAVSNLAWPADKSDLALDMLQKLGVKGLEVAPSLLFPRSSAPLSTEVEQCREARTAIADFGLDICSMQSVLFGVEGAELFGEPERRKLFLSRMLEAIGLAGRLGAPVIVLGSPKNRIIPDTMPAKEAEAIWRETFVTLGQAAQTAGTSIALEANPVVYNTNFMTTFSESVAVAQAVNHPAVGVNLDLGSFILNDEVSILQEVVRDCTQLIWHVHISAPFLKPVADHEEAISVMMKTLKAIDYDRWVSIEMANVFDAVEPAVVLCQELWECQR